MLKLGIQKDSTSNQYKYLWKISNYKLKQEVLPTLFRISPLYTKFSGAAKSVFCHCQIMYKEDFVNNLKTACGKLITQINSRTKHTLFVPHNPQEKSGNYIFPSATLSEPFKKKLSGWEKSCVQSQNFHV